ncbi:MAG: fumarylacetoacetate hydrolase family protein [Abditibacteriales bacterium]|nr:fumarylacetoacetate hydrolase family protein [Abditibacteriales bacterium]MDW8366332.1 fumarylacetoacetate hydrolase family protein [Abditibacteriales bacterium]
MRLVTLEIAGDRRLAAESNGRYVDLQWALAHKLAAGGVAEPERVACANLPSTMRQFLEAGEAAWCCAQQALSFAAESSRPEYVYSPEQVTLKAPVPDPRKIICVGLNYADHAAESGAAIPSEPVLFSKYPTAIIGPNEPILLPPESQEVDYEVELVFIIGKRGRRIPRERAMDYVAGYTVGHDVSARDWQLRKPGGQWLLGKTFDTFAPIGPALVTQDEVPDPHNLKITCKVNDELLQNSNTNQLIFKIDDLVAYISQVITLEPGDLVFTGTPAGVGFARKPPRFLQDGDVCELEVEGIGKLVNPVRRG